MAERDPGTVFVAENGKLADLVIQLLAARNIPAEMVGSGPRVETEPITGMSELTTSEEFEIRVTDPTKVAEAKEFLASAEGEAIARANLAKRANRTGTVTATCEDCGKPSDWPADRMGTTEVCPHCGAYVDVPDPDDDWSDVDFGTEKRLISDSCG